MEENAYGPAAPAQQVNDCWNGSDAPYPLSAKTTRYSTELGSERKSKKNMDGIQQLGLPVLGIVAAAAVTFYAVSFLELSEKSFRDLDEKEYGESGGYKPSASSRVKRARRKAEKQAKR
ncbi:hypothetical protein ACFX13_046719 [Malus domestica]